MALQSLKEYREHSFRMRRFPNLTSTLKSSRKVKYREEILTETQENDKTVDPYFENAIEIINRRKKFQYLFCSVN